MTSLIIGILLIAGGIAFAAAPLFKRRASSEPQGGQAGEGTSDAPRASGVPEAFSPFAAELDELELDRAMGKLAEGDYRALRAAIERRATTGFAAAPAAIQDSEARVEGMPAVAEPAADAERLPSAEVQETPARIGVDHDEEAERLIAAARARTVSCTSCGPRPEPDARFCSNCGRAIGGCPVCGHDVAQADARFCDRCGTALTP